LPVEIDPISHVGEDILNLGVYDRVVAEAIFRLLDPSEQAIDVGANIGQNVSIMALVAGRRGRVVAFEPGAISWSIPN
jgi:predicted KAP-like P-loop ATPase